MTPDELSHYSSATSDVEYLFPIGWSELEGIANRGDFDLTQHAKFSGQKLEYVDTATGDRYVPYVIEPAAGVDRAMLAFLVDAYDEDEIEGEQRTVLRLHPLLAPVKVAVLPLVRKDGQPELAAEVFRELREHVQAEYDEGGAIGRRYRRQDEIGTPWAVTIDHQSLEDRTRSRCATGTASRQVRVPIGELVDVIARAAPRAVALAQARRLATLSRHRAAKLHRRRMTASIAADQISYADLYARWEQGNWRATELDLSTDREQWEHVFTDLERRAALWTYSLFFHGEDAVADNLSPYIDAAPREEQKYFLATQQVDEARHAVLFARFMREVAGAGASVGIGSRWDPAEADVGLPEGLRAARPDGRRAARRPLPDASSPRRSRCTTSSSRPRWRSPASTSSRSR